MNDTHERLARALDDRPAVLDVEELISSSRRRGRGVRRRRRAVVAVAATAVLAVVGAGGVARFGPDGSTPVATDSASTTPSARAAGYPDIEDAWAAVAALRWALDQEVEGPVSSRHPSAGLILVVTLAPHRSTEKPSFGGALTITDTEGSAVVHVRIKAETERTFDCRDRPGCEVRELPDGSRVRTTADRIVVGTTEHGSNRVELMRRDGVLVTLSSENVHWRGSRGGITRPEPLSVGQLLALARLDVWGPDLPERFVEEGRVMREERDRGGR